jgi:hypothetical protein
MSDSFDSVAFMDTLIDGEFTQKQAKALASAIFQLADHHLVTRNYLDLAFAKLEVKMIRYMFALLIIQSGVTAVLFRLLH